MAGNSDLPPAYSSLQPPPATLNIDTVEEGEPKSDDRAELLVNHPFEDKTTRLIFFQKVLAIKILQLLGVVVAMESFAATFEYTNHCSLYYHSWCMNRNVVVHLIATSLIAYLVVFIILLCCDQARHQKPYKFIFLVAYPLSFAFFISSVTLRAALTEVTMAWAYHSVAVFALLIYNLFVMQTKFDFEPLHGFYISTAIQVVLYTFSVPFVNVDPFYVLYPTIVLALEHLYLLFALDVMTSNTYKTALTADDFVDAAINLHIDHIYIFIKLIVPKIRNVWRKCAAGMK